MSFLQSKLYFFLAKNLGWPSSSRKM